MSARTLSSVVLSVVLVLGRVSAVSGQSTLDRVEELARAGRALEARVLLTDWWDLGREEADRIDLQRGIWLRGVLTVDPEEASLDFRRLVVEYPGGPYTARALARIARAAVVSGDTAEAARTYETLARTHRDTPQGERALAWLEGRGHPSARMEDDPSSPDPTPGSGRSVSDEDAAPVRGADETDPSRRSFTVQLGAFSTMVRARALLRRARAAGLEPRLVRIPGSDLARVRVGRFATDSEAEAFRRGVVALGFEALVSDTAAREEPVGGG